MDITPSVSTCNIHGVTEIIVPLNLVSIVTIQQAGICTLLIVFKFVPFITAL